MSAERWLAMAAKIDERLGPISGADADRIAEMLRSAASRLKALTAENAMLQETYDALKPALARLSDMRLHLYGDLKEPYRPKTLVEMAADAIDNLKASEESLTAENARLETRLQHSIEHCAEFALALKAYRKAQRRMLEKWADGDDAVKADLWRNLHACDVLADEILDGTETDRVVTVAKNESLTSRLARVEGAAKEAIELIRALKPERARFRLEQSLSDPEGT